MSRILIILLLLALACGYRGDGTYILIYEADTPVDSTQIDETLGIMTRRLDFIGFKGANVQRLGDNQIQLQIPAFKGSLTKVHFNHPDDRKRFTNILKKLAEELEIGFVSVDIQGTNDLVIQSAKIDATQQSELRFAIQTIVGPKDTVEVGDGLGQLGFISFDDTKAIIEKPARLNFKERTCVDLYCVDFEDSNIGLTGDDLERSYPVVDSTGVGWSISFQFNDKGTAIFSDLARRISGVETKRIAIFLDDDLILAPVVRAWIRDGRTEITGNFDREEAALLSEIWSALLPVPLRLVGEVIVDPRTSTEAADEEEKRQR